MTFNGKLIDTIPNAANAPAEEIRYISGNIRQSHDNGNGKAILREAIKFRFENGTEQKDIIRITKEVDSFIFPDAIQQVSGIILYLDSTLEQKI